MGQINFNQSELTGNTLIISGINIPSRLDSAFAQANTTSTLAQNSFDTANTKLSTTGGTLTGNLIISESKSIIMGDVTTSNTVANYPSDVPAKYNVDIVGQFNTKRFAFNSYGGIAVGTTSSTSTGYSGQVLTSGGEFNGVSWADIPAPTPSYGAVGSYVFAYASQKVVDGSTYSGSILLPAGGTSSISYYPDDWSGWSYTAGGSALSGTWRCMGRANGQTYGITLFLRIY